MIDTFKISVLPANQILISQDTHDCRSSCTFLGRVPKGEELHFPTPHPYQAAMTQKHLALTVPIKISEI